MVRPIEITDTLSKVQAAERIQQNAKAATEAVQQFQKELAEKLAGEQVTTPNPAPPGDRIILHAEERDRGRRKTAEDRSESPGSGEKKPGEEDREDHGPAQQPLPGHIDITV